MTAAAKRCPDCGETKPLDAFYRHGSTRDRRQTYCKVCFNARQQRWYEANKERHNRIVSANRRRRQVHRLGVADEPQQCEACGATSDSRRNGLFRTGSVAVPRPKNLAIDHDHVSGEPRGVLCAHCNRALGLMDDDPQLLRALAEYIEHHIERRQIA